MQKLLNINIGLGSAALKEEIRQSLIGLHIEKIEELKIRDTSLRCSDERYFTSMPRTSGINSMSSKKKSVSSKILDSLLSKEK
jgi:hypothetical protein